MEKLTHINIADVVFVLSCPELQWAKLPKKILLSPQSDWDGRTNELLIKPSLFQQPPVAG